MLSSIRGARCAVAIPDAENLAEEARRVLEDPQAEIDVIGILSPARMLVECVEREGAGTLVVGSTRRGKVGRALSPTGRKVDSGWRQVVRAIADALAAACDPDVDLLVAGSRRPWDRFLLGSVTKHLIAEVPCPVLVVPGLGSDG